MPIKSPTTDVTEVETLELGESMSEKYVILLCTVDNWEDTPLLMKKKEGCSWNLAMKECDFKIKYIQGKTNTTGKQTNIVLGQKTQTSLSNF